MLLFSQHQETRSFIFSINHKGAADFLFITYTLIYSEGIQACLCFCHCNEGGHCVKSALRAALNSAVFVKSK